MELREKEQLLNGETLKDINNIENGDGCTSNKFRTIFRSV